MVQTKYTHEILDNFNYQLSKRKKEIYEQMDSLIECSTHNALKEMLEDEVNRIDKLIKAVKKL